MSTYWNETLAAIGPIWVARLLNMPLVSVISIYVLAFVLKADIWSWRRTFWAHSVIKTMWY